MLSVGFNTGVSNGKNTVDNFCIQRKSQQLRPIREPLKIAMAGHAGLAITVLLIFASVRYFVFW